MNLRFDDEEDNTSYPEVASRICVFFPQKASIFEGPLGEGAVSPNQNLREIEHFRGIGYAFVDETRVYLTHAHENVGKTRVF